MLFVVPKEKEDEKKKEVEPIDLRVQQVLTEFSDAVSNEVPTSDTSPSSSLSSSPVIV